MVLTGWHYLDGYKYYFREDGRLVQNVDPIIGKQSSYAIKVNKTANCLTVYAKDGDKGYIIPVMSMLTSVGDDTPIGTFKSPERYRWRYMVGDCYTQYATRITGSFLLHSVIYDKQNNRTLRAQTYNDLGIARSAGCVRLRTVDAKWIYDNVQAGVPITIYEDEASVGPFYRPDIVAGTQYSGMGSHRCRSPSAVMITYRKERIGIRGRIITHDGPLFRDQRAV